MGFRVQGLGFRAKVFELFSLEFCGILLAGGGGGSGFAVLGFKVSPKP